MSLKSNLIERELEKARVARTRQHRLRQLQHLRKHLAAAGTAELELLGIQKILDDLLSAEHKHNDDMISFSTACREY